VADVVRAGRRTFQNGQRVDLGDIARAVGIGRTTLHRWVGRRERFLGLVIASLGEAHCAGPRARCRRRFAPPSG
jgi:hypothetical protein